MKPIYTLMLLLGLVGACNKSENSKPGSNNTNNNGTNPNSDRINTVTITDNGNTYTAYGYDENVSWSSTDSAVWGVLDRTTGPEGSYVGVKVEGGKMPFKLDIAFDGGKPDGLGFYNWYTAGQELESYYDGKKYLGSDTASAFVTSIDDKKRVKGTFYVRFVKGSDKKVITGTFDFQN